jgi:AcrR family transcriptional regulator
MSSGGPETRTKIMEATRELVEQSQGKTIRLEDIAKRAGVSRQAIYLHFGSRVGLMVATVQYVDETEGFFERTRHVREAENGLVAFPDEMDRTGRTIGLPVDNRDGSRFVMDDDFGSIVCEPHVREGLDKIRIC